MLEKNLNDLNLSAKESIFVGDSERDLLASKAINMDYIMVNWGFSTYQNAIHSVDKLEKKLLEF
jgi:phosphoglycolate phosphatase-like HAD superfamily hydrolase